MLSAAKGASIGHQYEENDLNQDRLSRQAVEVIIVCGPDAHRLIGDRAPWPDDVA
jgi:hypothetical protein